MRKIIFGMLLLASLSISAQENVKEPTFTGEAFIIQTDNSTLNLEKEQVNLKTRAGASIYLVGSGTI